MRPKYSYVIHGLREPREERRLLSAPHLAGVFRLLQLGLRSLSKCRRMLVCGYLCACVHHADRGREGGRKGEMGLPSCCCGKTSIKVPNRQRKTRTRVQVWLKTEASVRTFIMKTHMHARRSFHQNITILSHGNLFIIVHRLRS